MRTPTTEGGCRCGRVRFRLTAEPWLEVVCHCRGCQRMTASAFSTTLVVPADGFEIASGAVVPGGQHAPEAAHRHCDHCKSWVFTTSPLAPGSVNVRATLLDDPSGFRPWLEVQTAEKLAWVELPAARRYERFPAMHEYAALIAEYRAARGGRAGAAVPSG